MKSVITILIVLAVLGALIFFPLMGARNELVQQREAVTAAWSQVENVMQRRGDLIPNLVETVKGMSKQEQAVIDSVTSARAAMGGARTQAEKVQANDQLSSALSRLLVVVEQYPQIKSSEGYMSLKDELASSENRIAVERRKYNETLQKYNTERDQFPKNIAASLFGFERNDAYFKAEPAAKEVPKVKF